LNSQTIANWLWIFTFHFWQVREFWALTPKGKRQPKWVVALLGTVLWTQYNCGFFETFWGCRYGWQFSNEMLNVAFGFTVDELEGFKKFSLALGMFLATVNAANFAQIYPKTKLWNTTKNLDFSVFQKKKILCVEEALEHVSTIRIFNP
jgi:hypothetical protein